MLFRSPAWDEVAYWALDLETGGFDPRSDAIIAVGMVPVRKGIIRLSEGWRTLVRPEEGRAVAPESVQAHQILLAELEGAPPLGEVLPEVERRIREGALIVHHKAFDVRFLRPAFERHGLTWPKPRVVDTADLLVRLARFKWPHEPSDLRSLNLSRARLAHGLPPYQAHDALTDAVATAELFLVLRKALGARRLRELC